MPGRPSVNFRFGRDAFKTLLFGVALCAVIFSTSVAHAQILYGSLTGTVSDKTGAVIPGITVTITDQGTGQIRSDKNGRGWLLPDCRRYSPEPIPCRFQRPGTLPDTSRKTSRWKLTARCAETSLLRRPLFPRRSRSPKRLRNCKPKPRK